MVSYSNKIGTERLERNDDMAKSAKKIISDNRWNAKAYYRPSINLRREYEDAIRERAKELNMSMSTYIQTLVKMDLESHIL